MTNDSYTARIRRVIDDRGVTALPALARDELRRRRSRVRGTRRVYRQLVEKELEWKVPLRMRRPRWWRHGFLSRSAVLYRLDEHGPEHYVSDVQRYRSTKRMVHPRLQDVINNKFTTHLLFRSIDVPTTELLGVYWRGAVHRFPAEDRIPLPDYLASLDDGQRVFVKPLTGAEGKRILSVRRIDDKFKMNGEMHDLESVQEAIEADKRPLVVETGVEQHPAQRALFAETTNTIRLLTMLDLEDRQPFIAVAVQRIGTRRSGHVDNWSQGGLSARVDVETGQLGPATWLPDDGDDSLSWFARHPETGAPIEGAVVPFWEETKHTVLHASRILSFMEYIGWDVIVGPDGPVILEANINSGMNVLQVHQPLLADPRARRYFAKRGVVPR